MMFLLSIMQGLPRSISATTAHFIYQHNGTYVDYYNFFHERQVCASSANAGTEFSTVSIIGMVLFKLIPWCLICILNGIITWKLNQQEQWELRNSQNRQVRFQFVFYYAKGRRQNTFVASDDFLQNNFKCMMFGFCSSVTTALHVRVKVHLGNETQLLLYYTW